MKYIKNIGRKTLIWLPIINLMSLLCFNNYVSASQDTEGESETLFNETVQQIQLFADDIRSFLTEEVSGHNPIHAPFSYYLALLALEPGLTGEHQEMLDRVLIPESVSQEKYFSTIETLLKETMSEENSVFKTQTYLLADQEKEWLDDYMTVVEPLFIEPMSVNFRDNETYHAINEEIAEFTNGLIDPYFSSERIDESVQNTDLRLIALNLLYFNGEWKNEFSEKSTVEEAFYGIESETVIEMMHQKDKFSYVEMEDYQAISLPYTNDASLIVVLPTEDQTSDKMWEYYHEVLSDETAWEMKEIELSLPKFEVSASLDLTDSLSYLGIEEFQKHLGETKFFINNESILISQILQRIEFIVDEKGTEAAAVTEVIMETTAVPITEEPVKMVINRPFVYGITYQKLPLFEGITNQIGE